MKAQALAVAGVILLFAAAFWLTAGHKTAQNAWIGRCIHYGGTVIQDKGQDVCLTPDGGRYARQEVAR